MEVAKEAMEPHTHRIHPIHNRAISVVNHRQVTTTEAEIKWELTDIPLSLYNLHSRQLSMVAVAMVEVDAFLETH